MADLPTNFLDDILSDSMGGKRRFKITRLDGSSEEVTIEDISKYDQVGSTFGAGDINKTNQAVNEKFDSDDVVDPMLATEEGFAADAYKTKLQFDEQNKKARDVSTYTLQEVFYMSQSDEPHLYFTNWNSTIGKMLDSNNAYLFVTKWTCIAITYLGNIFVANKDNLSFEKVNQRMTMELSGTTLVINSF